MLEHWMNQTAGETEILGAGASGSNENCSKITRAGEKKTVRCDSGSKILCQSRAAAGTPFFLEGLESIDFDEN